MIIETIQIHNLVNFDIKQIANSGQCFRMNPHPTEPNTFTVIAYGHYLKVKQEPGSSTAEFWCTLTEMQRIWTRYFDLETNYKYFIDHVDPEDSYLSAAVAAGAGIRILRQSLWETVVSFIISQNNNIPRIKATIEKLCKCCGQMQTAADGTIFYNFPTPEVLAIPENLQSVGLGYRDKYIVRLAENVLSGNIDFQQFCEEPFSSFSEEYTENYLKSIYGIGPKVANCIQLFGLHQIGVFPIDTWINKIIQEQYNGKFPVELYNGFAGVIQQYLFNYAVHGGNVHEWREF